ncbi:NADPH oxidase 4 [Branchiostoma belcheri]|nr:NADPH oxidase 4 [Branchiostoma belcheri]
MLLEFTTRSTFDNNVGCPPHNLAVCHPPALSFCRLRRLEAGLVETNPGESAGQWARIYHGVLGCWRRGIQGSEQCYIVPVSGRVSENHRPKAMVRSARNWAANDAPTYFALLLWLAANVLVFHRTFTEYMYQPRYYYLHEMLGLGLCVSRASASVLNLNCGLVLLPMCRTVLAVIRGSTQCVGRKARRVLDGSRKFHMLCGAAICVAAVQTGKLLFGAGLEASGSDVFGTVVSGDADSIVATVQTVLPRKSQRLTIYNVSADERRGTAHTLGHFYNALNFSEHYNVKYPGVNAAAHPKQDPIQVLLTTVPGLTGVAMVLLLLLIVSTSSMAIRTGNYELFWYTHHLFLILYCLMLLHPMRGVLKEQLNLEEHPPGCHMLMDNGDTDEFGRRVTCKGPPTFDTHAVEVWVWLVGPFCLYCAERVYRLVRSNTPAAVHRIIEHPNDVVELQLTKDGFTAKPGQYVVVNCPDVSTLEYHPFTLTMCPSTTDPTFSIHLQKMGDWTESLYERLLPDPDETDESLPVMVHRQYPILYIDGPFGSPSENVFHYDVSLCIAGGIGITPFASVLNHLLNEGTTSSRLRRLYLIWVCKNITSFLWIAQVLSSLQRQAWNENRPDFLNIYLHLTRSRDVQIMEREYPFLNSRLHVGRPQWRHIFDEVARYNPSTTVGVFLCGPKGMSKGIKRICLKKNKFHTKFEFHKENF